MIKIAVTGSIASGKTTVAKMLSGKKYLLFDADKEVKKIYKKRFFKNKIIKKLGTNNKNQIKKLLSKNPEKLRTIEKIIHPLVRKELKSFVKKNKRQKFLIFEIPLLIESRLMKSFDKIILVNSKKVLRLKRYLKRRKNKIFFKLLDKRQLSPIKKIKFSDHVINNNVYLKNLRKNVMIIKNKILMK